MNPPALGEVLTPDQAMAWALLIARRGAGFVSPNPMVGCVIVDSSHRFMADGWHRKLGQGHAEVDAVERFVASHGSREKIKGCHIYVTLEPCAHEGRTGSCAKMLAPLQPASVTYAIQDPNPLVAGTGAKILRDAGVKTICLAEEAAPASAALAQEARELAEIFLWSMTQPKGAALPFVTVKIASSLDGRVAMKSGESQWITGPEARQQGHRLRLEHDAIIVGRKTVETDDPTLNVRLDGVVGHTNSVVVIDPKGRLLEKIQDSKIASSRSPDRVFICVQEGAADAEAILRCQARGYRVFSVPAASDAVVDLRAMLRKLREFGLASVYIEGGAGTVGPFLDARLVNRLHVFMATTVLGGRHTIGWSDLSGGSTLANGWTLRDQRVQLTGSDVHITGRLD